MKISIRKICNFVTILLLSLIVFSCTSTKSLLIEIPQPSKKELPANIQSLTIVSQTVDGKYEDFNADSLQKIFYEHDFDLDTVIYDRQVADTTLKVLGELLFESGRYDFVIPENRFLKQRKSNSFFSIEMPWDEVRELCETYNTDAVLSLDYLSTRVSTDFDRETYFNPYENGFYSAAQAQMTVYYEALFRVYYPEEERILVREFMRDTLVWEDMDASVNSLFDRFVPVKKALTEAGISIALDFTDKISVIWQTERRTYFTKGNDAFEQANQLVDAGNWNAAVKLWKEAAENSKSKATKSKALYNVAVGYEMTGDLNQAILWAIKSYETMYRPLTYEYLEKLKDRKNELKTQ